MFPPKIFVVACALIACLEVGEARTLKQTGTTSDFTKTAETYIVSTTLVSSGATAETADACITLCLNDANCVYWSWCPATQTAGCSVPGIAGAAASTVTAKGCVLSYDETEDRMAVYAVSGAGVTFEGGKWNPSNTAPTTTPGAAVNASDPASWIDPTGTPSECTGFWSGNQWSGDEIECHMCSEDWQLKCDLDTDLIGDDSVKCEFDAAGAGSLTNNAYEFECTVDYTKVPQNQCPWDEFSTKVPACAVEPIKRIMATWRPDE